MTYGKLLLGITAFWLAYIAWTSDGTRRPPDLLLEDANANLLSLREGVR